jgi:cold shock CspA family protein
MVQRALWLERFCDTIISVCVVIEAPHKHHRNGHLYHVRIDLRVPGQQLVVSRDPKEHGAHKGVYIAIHDAFDEARRVLEDYVRKHRRDIKTPAKAPHGVVAPLIREDGGFGFIRTLDEREFYFHSRSVLDHQYERLQQGTEVRFTEEQGEEGPQASTVEIVGQEEKEFLGNLKRVS